MAELGPAALEGAAPAIRDAIRRLAALPDAPPVPAGVPRKAQAAVAAVLFQAPSRARASNDISAQSALCLHPDGVNGRSARDKDASGSRINGETTDSNHKDARESDEFEPELHVICTTRAMHLSSHPGQASLPGGKCDQSDKSVAATAFRETCEEIGLDEGALASGECVHLCTLRPFLSKTALLVHPVVFWLPPKTAGKVLDSLYASPDEVDDLWSYPLRAVLSSQEPRQVRKASSSDGSPTLGEPLMKLSDPTTVDRHRAPQHAYRTYSDVPWLLDGHYRLHRFRSTRQLIKGMTADVLMLTAAHAFRGTPLEGPQFPVFSPSQASWDDKIAYICARNMTGAPRMKGRWGDGESGDAYGSVARHATVVGQDWAALLRTEAKGSSEETYRNREDDERLVRREDPVTYAKEGKQATNTNGINLAQA